MQGAVTNTTLHTKWHGYLEHRRRIRADDGAADGVEDVGGERPGGTRVRRGILQKLLEHPVHTWIDIDVTMDGDTTWGKYLSQGRCAQVC